MKKSAKRWLTVGVGLLIGMLLAEVVLWVVGAIDAGHIPAKEYRDEGDNAGELRLAVLGGSTSAGTPYADYMASGNRRFNLLSVTAFLLEKRCGAGKVEIDDYAGPNWSAETTVEHYFERPGRKPDVLVLYSGQNETTRYYSPNMVPPPSFFAPWGRFKFGSLVLRRLFTRQVTAEDQRYTGQFFSDNIIPQYEREYNLGRYRLHVDRLIRHAAAEGIFLIIVIPQSNYLFPPTRSVYAGPRDRKAEALKLFKEAWYARHVETETDRAQALFGKLIEFCSFADLLFELGELHYSKGEFETALKYLARARDADGFPTSITRPYREVLKELVAEHDVPHIDMDELIREESGRPVPDYTVFVDDCHLQPHTYLLLSKAIIRAMDQRGFDNLELSGKDLGMTDDDWSDGLGLTPNVQLGAIYLEADYHVRQADYAFLKRRNLARAYQYLQHISEPAPQQVSSELEEVTRALLAEQSRMISWVGHDGPMPIGRAAGEMGEQDFGGGVDIEASQGDRFGAHGEFELAAKHYRAALAVDPNDLRSRIHLGISLYHMKRFDEAIEELERALEIDSDHPKALRSLGKIHFERGAFEEAMALYRAASRSAPEDREIVQDYCVAAARLAWQLSTDPNAANRDGERAVVLAEEAAGIIGNGALDILDVLSAAYAESGRFEDAVSTAKKALSLAGERKHPLEQAIAARLTQFRAGQPWRQGPAGTGDSDQ